MRSHSARPVSEERQYSRRRRTLTYGGEVVTPTERKGRIRNLFDRLATRYELMNDVISCGIHRLWK